MRRAELVPGAAFWREAFAFRGAATARVMSRTIVFGVIAATVSALHREVPTVAIRAEVVAMPGIVLGFLLVFRTAGGYERWWEARTLWGQIVNGSRNIVVAALAYGPEDQSWRLEVARWVSVFAHATRHALRDEQHMPDVAALVGETEAARIAAAKHMPSYVAGRLAALLRRARETHRLDDFAFLRIESERAALLDYVGGCERILKTPIPEVYSVTIRRLVVLYLCALPFALVGPAGLLSPVYAVLIAYPVLTLEQIGAELQNPFVKRSLSHLDLEELCVTIEGDVGALTRQEHGGAPLRAQRTSS